MNPLNPEKLALSKWTAVTPRDREKHFIVTKVMRGAGEKPVACILEAVHSHREYEIDWQELRDATRWLQGWK
jgi:tryptophan-rich hypothetical protein